MEGGVTNDDALEGGRTERIDIKKDAECIEALSPGFDKSMIWKGEEFLKVEDEKGYQDFLEQLKKSNPDDPILRLTNVINTEAGDKHSISDSEV